MVAGKEIEACIQRLAQMAGPLAFILLWQHSGLLLMSLPERSRELPNTHFLPIDE